MKNKILPITIIMLLLAAGTAFSRYKNSKHVKIINKKSIKMSTLINQSSYAIPPEFDDTCFCGISIPDSLGGNNVNFSIQYYVKFFKNSKKAELISIKHFIVYDSKTKEIINCFNNKGFNLNNLRKLRIYPKWMKKSLSFIIHYFYYCIDTFYNNTTKNYYSIIGVYIRECSSDEKDMFYLRKKYPMY